MRRGQGWLRIGNRTWHSPNLRVHTQGTAAAGPFRTARRSCCPAARSHVRPLHGHHRQEHHRKALRRSWLLKRTPRRMEALVRPVATYLTRRTPADLMSAEITLLGTGAPLHVSRATTGMLVTAEGCAPLLLDTCGGFELPRRLNSAGFPLAHIRNVIVTHRHFDHSGGLMALFLANIPLDISLFGRHLCGDL